MRKKGARKWGQRGNARLWRASYASLSQSDVILKSHWWYLGILERLLSQKCRRVTEKVKSESKETRYSKSPTYKPPSCKLSKMWVCIPSTSGMRETAACSLCLLALTPCSSTISRPFPPPVSSSYCLFTQRETLHASCCTAPPHTVTSISRSVVPDSETPWTAACQASLSMGLFQARILERVAVSFSRASSQPRDRTWVSCTAGKGLYYKIKCSLYFLCLFFPYI